jgi:site-specific DNA-methyltransferase (adenine-specific)
MLNQTYNPDVLTCIANLSSDEVFTPPSVVNQMLDTLPKELWNDEKVTFLDPVSKSGVFLREITKRLIDGLESKIPNLEERIEHILRNQVFGIGITELTSLISRRSLYCSKYANGKYSIVQFDDEQGNLKYFETEHTWEGRSCKYCGVSKEIYDRGEELESYSYSLIHSKNPEKLFNMKFDVIVGNPPYQMNDGGGGGSAIPLYHKFIETSKKLNPKFLTMIIPSRWFSGGRGLDSFREEMLNDTRISKLVDFPSSSDCFPGVEIKGGVCYFLWEREYKGKCEISTLTNGEKDTLERPLLEEGLNFFIRYNKSISILRKVNSLKEEKFDKVVSSMKPYGLRTYFKGKPKSFPNSIKIYHNGGYGYISNEEVIINQHNIKEHKVLISRAYGAGEDFPHQILNKPFYSEPNSVCTETYLQIGPFINKLRTENVITYIKTKFFRFMVLLIKNTQDAPKSVYRLVPIQNFDEEWSDEKLYKKYGLNEEEIEFIETMIRPME